MTVARWCRDNPDRTRIGDDTLIRNGAEIRVSTVYLYGLDHQYGDGPPVLWETMVFAHGGDVAMDRYTTFADAEQGHARYVDLARSGAYDDAERSEP